VRLAHRPDRQVPLLGAHPREHRQRHGPPRVVLGERQRRGGLGVVGAEVDGRIVDGRLHPPLGEGGAEPVPVDRRGEHRREHAVAVALPPVGRGGRLDQLEILERLAVGRVDRGAALVFLVEAPQQGVGEGGPGIVEAVVEAAVGQLVLGRGLVMAVPGLRAEAVPAPPRDPGRQLVVVGGQHPALADADVLGAREAEGAGQAERPRVAPVRPGAAGVGGVLDQDEAAPRGELGDRRRLAEVPAVGHRHDRFGAGPDCRLHRLDREPGLGRACDVGEAGTGADVGYRVDGRGEGQRGDDRLLSGPEAGRVAGQVQGGATAADGDRAARAGIARERLLELGGARPAGQPT
jgi:hypothetical protein